MLFRFVQIPTSNAANNSKTHPSTGAVKRSEWICYSFHSCCNKKGKYSIFFLLFDYILFFINQSDQSFVTNFQSERKNGIIHHKFKWILGRENKKITARNTQKTVFPRKDDRPNTLNQSSPTALAPQPTTRVFTDIFFYKFYNIPKGIPNQRWIYHSPAVVFWASTMLVLLFALRNMHRIYCWTKSAVHRLDAWPRPVFSVICH